MNKNLNSQCKNYKKKYYFLNNNIYYSNKYIK